MQFAKHTLLFCCLVLWENIEAVVNNENAALKSFVKNYNRHKADISIHKVSFTQKGYIQVGIYTKRKKKIYVFVVFEVH